MGFETKILNVVADITDGAYFFNGTLCITDICEDTAKVVLCALRQAVRCEVKMSNIVFYEPKRTVEFLYDFV